jgi:hypothetical protein
MLSDTLIEVRRGSRVSVGVCDNGQPKTFEEDCSLDSQSNKRWCLRDRSICLHDQPDLTSGFQIVSHLHYWQLGQD